jgi:hypothetical protein
MPLTAPRYRIAFAHTPDDEHEVAVTPADQLRAEVEGNRRGLVEPARQGMLLTMLWLWAACRREALAPTDETFDRFVDSLLVWERVKPDEPVAVDPTRRAGSSTDSSPSAPGSPASTGSTPSSETPPSSRAATDSSGPTTATTEGVS